MCLLKGIILGCTLLCWDLHWFRQDRIPPAITQRQLLGGVNCRLLPFDFCVELSASAACAAQMAHFGTSDCTVMGFWGQSPLAPSSTRCRLELGGGPQASSGVCSTCTAKR